MSAKLELCSEHAKQLRAIDLLNGNPTEIVLSSESSSICGCRTLQLYGKTTIERVNSCKLRAEILFTFGKLRI